MADANERAEDALLQALLCLRGLHLLQGAVSTAVAWRAYRRPRLVAAVLVVSASESIWLARRYGRRHAVDDPTAAWVDTAVGVGGLVALRAATRGSDSTTFMNWACPTTYDTAASAPVALGRGEALAAATAVAGTFVLSTMETIGADRSVLATVVANGLGYLGHFVAGDRFARYLRGSATEIERARRDAVERGERLAAERERVRQYELFSHSALATIDLIADGWDADADDAVRARVRREAARLRAVLSGQPHEDDDRLLAALRSLTEDAAVRGLSVELLLTELHAEPTPDQIAALIAATREALNNVARHARVSRVVVRAASTADQVEVTVRDHGAGCDTDQLRGHLVGNGGIAQRIIDPMRNAGGTAELESASGNGMLVTLRIPRIPE